MPHTVVQFRKDTVEMWHTRILHQNWSYASNPTNIMPTAPFLQCILLNSTFQW